MSDNVRKEKTTKKAGMGTAVLAAAKKATARPERRPNRVKLLVSIVNPGDEVRLTEILNDFSVSLNHVFSGTGTARSAVLDYLGIGTTEKSVMFSLIPESDEEAILREIRTRMSLYLVGRGISFTLPLSAISEIVAKGIVAAATEKTVDGRKVMKDENRKYDLIIAEVAAGFVDDAMEAARSAGAAGGTILRARSVNNSKAEQFIGISLQKETEILLILAQREGKTAIMNALSEAAGLKTEAGGVLFSLPVDRTVGIGASGGETDASAAEQSTDEARE